MFLRRVSICRQWSQGRDAVLCQICVLLFLFATFFNQYSAFTETINPILKVISSLVLLVVMVLRKVRIGNIEIGIMTLLGSLILLNALVVGSSSLNNLALLLIASVVGLYLARYGINRRLAWFFFWVMICLSVVLLILSPNGYYIFPELTMSRNYLSIFLILTFSLLCIAHRGGKSSADMMRLFIAAAAVFVVAVLAKSRSGILSTGLIFAIICIHFIVAEKRDLRIRALPFLVGIIVLFTLMLWNGGSVLSDLFYRFDPSEKTVMSSNSQRFEMIALYLEGCMQDMNWLFGINPLSLDSATILRHEGNLHNSYLLLHSGLGLVGLLIVVIALIRETVSSGMRGDIWMMAALIGFMIRIGTDAVVPFMYGDFLIAYCIFVYSRRPTLASVQGETKKRKRKHWGCVGSPLLHKG